MRDERASAGARPWAQPRWFESAERWLRASSASLGYEPIGPVEQVQVWELSCVLRLPTARGDVYFKATADSPLFVNEGVVMGVLAGLFSDRVPRPLAVDAERLLAAGCTDRRLPRLAMEAERWLPEIEATGRLPGIDAATWLSADEMAALRPPAEAGVPPGGGGEA